MFELFKRMAVNMLAILHTRAELLAVEVEEEVLRLFCYLILSLIALVCFGLTALLAVLLVVVAFWDTHRMAAVVGMMGVFGITAIGIALYVRHAFNAKPKFLSSTLGEMAKDIEMVRPADRAPPL